MAGRVYNSTHSLERKSSWMGRSVDDVMVVIVDETAALLSYFVVLSIYYLRCASSCGSEGGR